MLGILADSFRIATRTDQPGSYTGPSYDLRPARRPAWLWRAPKRRRVLDIE